MIEYSKIADEKREAGAIECWCLHGSVGAAADFRTFAKDLAVGGIGSRAVDLWRFLECGPMSLPEFATAFNAEANGEVFRGDGRALLGYSMGGRMALHALLGAGHPWQAAVIVSAHPGIENPVDRASRRAQDAEWGARAFAGDWYQFMEKWNSQPVLGSGRIREPEASARLISRRREVARSFVDWTLGAQDPLWERLGEIQVPVLWIAGENDAKYRGIAERAVEALPKGFLAIAPGAAHRVPWEAEPWFAGIVSKFLKTGR